MTEAKVPEPEDEVTLFGPALNKTGPWHLARNDHGYAWCGAKQQFRHTSRPGTIADVTCATCLRRLALGQPLSWKARS